MGEQSTATVGAVPAALDAGPEGIDGLEFLNRIKDGRIPQPGMAVLLGLDMLEVEPGRIVFAATPTKAHANPAGATHGGFAATILDTCMTCAVQSTLKAGLGCTTLDLHVHYTRAANENSGLLRAEGKVIHAGRQFATAEGRLTDPQGRIVAHATTSCLIFPLRG